MQECSELHSTFPSSTESSFSTHQVPSCCTYIHGRVAFHGSTVGSPGATFLKNTDSSSTILINCIAPGLGVVSSSPLHSDIQSGLNFHGACACYHSCCELICTASLLLVPLTFFMPPFSLWFLSLGRKCAINVPFSVGTFCSLIFCTLASCASLRQSLW